MKLHYFAALVIFSVLLFGCATSAHSQQKHTCFGSSKGLPTRLFGSTNGFGRLDECALSCGDCCNFGCGQKDACGDPAFRGPKCTPVCRSSQKPCNTCNKGATQKCMAQKCVRRKNVAQKSFAQKSVAQKSVAQKSVVQKGESDCCNCECRPNPVVRALAKFDGAVKGIFRGKSNCCEPCPDLCCDTSKSYIGYGGKSDSACGSTYGSGSGDYGSPAEFGTPSPYDDLEEPLLDGNPFEDDAVQPPPPAPSEVSRPSRPRPLLGPVAAREMSSPFRVQTPARIRPINAAPLRKKTQLAKSILDRGNSTSSRRYADWQPSVQLTSAQTEVSNR